MEKCTGRKRFKSQITIIAKNYLSDKEVISLNRLTTSFLDLAEARAERRYSTMEDWKKQLDDFLTVYGYDKFHDSRIILLNKQRKKRMLNMTNFA